MMNIPTDTARVVTVIVTTLTRRGMGKDETDPVRVITQFWTLDGELLVERDSWVLEQRP